MFHDNKDTNVNAIGEIQSNVYTLTVILITDQSLTIYKSKKVSVLFHIHENFTFSSELMASYIAGADQDIFQRGGG